MLTVIGGAPGTGKSWFIKELLRKWGIPESEIIAMDINKEYDTEYRFYDHHELIESCYEFKNKTFVFEEATSFFSHNNDRKIKRFFTTHRHNNRIIFANFHSLASIPGDLLMCMDYLYFTETVEKKPPEWVKEMTPYTLYTRADIIGMQN
jgi:hypothetical protein